MVGLLQRRCYGGGLAAAAEVEDLLEIRGKKKTKNQRPLKTFKDLGNCDGTHVRSCVCSWLSGFTSAVPQDIKIWNDFGSRLLPAFTPTA